MMMQFGLQRALSAKKRLHANYGSSFGLIRVFGLNLLGFEASGELMVMLILGGVGRLYGAVVGPLKVDRGWQLLKVEALHPAVLDETTRRSLQAALFQEWLNDQRRVPDDVKRRPNFSPAK